MWNIVASGLLAGAPVVLYDGSPTYPGSAAAVADRRRPPGRRARRQPRLPARQRQGRAAPRAAISTCAALRTLGVTGAPLHRRSLPLGARPGRAARPGRLDQRRHRRGQRLRRQRPDHRGVGRARSPRRCSASPSKPGTADGQPRDRRGRRARRHPAHAVDAAAASGTTPTARATATPTSPPTPASGGTATGW